MQIYNLVIELTRRCNMQCAHCLRGEAQKISQKREHIAAVFSQVDYISSLTLTGGEPSIVPHIINMIIDGATVYNVDIGNFYIATNGKKITPKFVEAVERLYRYCSDNEISAVEISNDVYHDNPKWTDAYEALLELPYAHKKWDVNRDSRNMIDGKWEYDPYRVIAQGRALDNGLGYKDIEIDNITINAIGEIDEDARIEGTIYLNCKGWIISGCDWSFATQDDKSFEGRICHVKDFSFEAIKKYTHATTEFALCE